MLDGSSNANNIYYKTGFDKIKEFERESCCEAYMHYFEEHVVSFLLFVVIIVFIIVALTSEYIYLIVISILQ